MRQLTLTGEREVRWVEVDEPGLITSRVVPWGRAAEAVGEPETKLVVSR